VFEPVLKPLGAAADQSLQAWLGHKNIQHTVRYTELAPDRFKNRQFAATQHFGRFWREADTLATNGTLTAIRLAGWPPCDLDRLRQVQLLLCVLELFVCLISLDLRRPT